VAHVLDSLTAVPLLRSAGIDAFVDLGSGGGLPGLPLAIALPAQRALLVESTGKKARFLETAVAAVVPGGDDPRPGAAGAPIAPIAVAAVRAEGLARDPAHGGDVTGSVAPVAVAAVRAEALARDPAHRGAWPCVTARAVAALPDLVELAVPLLGPGGILVAWKRGDLTGELDAGRRGLDALGGGRVELHPVELPALAGHALVVVTAEGQAPAAYPRDPAARARRPW
jgi:16S rRNA (guanine527-N7)-methyltransferase